jgi:hypothetical protein
MESEGQAQQETSPARGAEHRTAMLKKPGGDRADNASITAGSYAGQRGYQIGASSLVRRRENNEIRIEGQIQHKPICRKRKLGTAGLAMNTPGFLASTAINICGATALRTILCHVFFPNIEKTQPMPYILPLCARSSKYMSGCRRYGPRRQR